MGKLLSTAAALLVLLAVSGCAVFGEAEPAPDYFDDLQAGFTRGVPDERPMPPLVTEGLSEEEIRAIRVYRENHRAVVNVTSMAAYRFRLLGTIPRSGVGSGAIISPRGVVVTNHHVVEGAQRLMVTLYDGSRYPAQLVGSDPEMDLAVLRFNPLGRGLSTVQVGDSSALQVGQRVFALGNPFGLDGTLSAGVVSALNRPIQLQSGFIMRDLIQSDAAINPGNSGGPLFNSRGEMVGINSMLIGPSAGNVGISLSIPSRSVVRIAGQILQDGRVNRGWIDIEGVAMNERLARAAGRPHTSGVLVTRVLPGGNAEPAGLRDGKDGRMIRHGGHRIPVEGDILIAVNDQRVRNVSELLASLEATSPGEQARVTLLRGDEKLDRELRLGERPRHND